MEESLDLLFERYRRTGDPALLAEVFDRTAPRLLRATVHLTGEAASAEDLVQATFVTAIERAATWDARRPIEGWLTGILGNKARETRKRESREIDLDRLARQEVVRPDDEAGERETSAALVQAIDELPEAYRQPLLLRLRHGLGPAEIAHVLGESPGSIRVRLHRGIEKLRKLLPAGIVGAALFVTRPARGLAAVREVVIAHAGSVPVAVGAGSILGGVFAVKKLALAGIALLLILVLVGGSRFLRSEELSETLLEDSSAFAPERVGGAETASASRMEATPAPEKRAAASAERVAGESLEGRVLDVATQVGIPGAVLDLYPPRHSRLSEIRRRWPDRVLRSGGGTFLFVDSWPWVPRDRSDAALGDLEDILVLDPPMPDAKPVATVTSDADGRFAFSKDLLPGFVVCRAEAFATRFRPILEGSEPITVWMSRPWRLEGHVIDTGGRRIERGIRLAFTGGEPLPDAPLKDRLFSTFMGCWVTTTRADGSFEIEVAAPSVHARSLEPGLLLVSRGKDPNGDGRWVFRSSFGPETESPAVLVASSPPVLFVRDALTKEPIEDFRMISTAGGRRSASWIGRMWAPGGRLTLVEFDPETSAYSKSEVASAHVFQIWSDGYVPARVETPNLLVSGEIVVDLERGETPGLEGVVLRGGIPVDSATVALISSIGGYWREDEWGLVAAARTDLNGRFDLRAPEGRYLLRTTFPDQTSCRSVKIPSADPIRIDFDCQAAVHIRLRGEDGAPKSKHVVALMGDDKSDRKTHTDENGVATFSNLSGGEYRVFVPYKTTEDSFPADEIRSISLAEGERVEIEIVFPDLEPRHPKLVVDGKAPGLGWSVRNRSSPTEPAADVAADGSISIEIQAGVQELGIEGPDGRLWTFPIPNGSPDGFELRVELGGLAYEGSVVHANDGKPMANVLVCVWPDSDGPDRDRSYRARTDSSGRFRISGLDSGGHRISFHPGDREGRNNELLGLSFVPSDPPSEHPRPLTIRLPRTGESDPAGASTCEISGTVRVAGSIAIGKTVSISSWVAVEGGTLVISTLAGMGDIDDDGRFRVRVQRASRYRALLDANDDRLWGPLMFDADPAAVSIERDLDFP